MRHLKALLIKFIVISVVVLSMLPIFETASVTDILFISLLVTGIAYIIGDLFILRKFGNFSATLADFGLAFVSIWMLASFLIEAAYPIVIVSLFSAFFIAICEAFYHAYLIEKVFVHDEKESRMAIPNYRFQTEFSEEEHTENKSDR